MTRVALGFRQLLELLVAEFKRGRGDVLLQMLDRRGARDRQHHRRAPEQPGERDLARCSIVAGGYLVEWTAGPRQVPGGQREPGDEAHALAFAEVEYVFGAAADEVVAVLHRGYRYDVPRLFDLFDADLREAHVPDLALLAQLGQSAHLLLGGDTWVYAMQLVEVYAVDFQPPEAPLACFAQMLGPAVGLPTTRPRTCKATLRGHDQTVWVGVKGFSDKAL